MVENDRDVQRLLHSFFTRQQMQVRVAEDGMDALSLPPSAYDLVLLDLQMPRLDGIETAKRLRNLGFEGPIIGLSGETPHATIGCAKQASPSLF